MVAFGEELIIVTQQTRQHQHIQFVLAQGFGLLNGGFPIPSVSVSWMHRTVPRLRYGSLGPAPGTGDQFEFTMDLRSDSYRAVAGWKFVLVDVAAGTGRWASLCRNRW